MPVERRTSRAIVSEDAEVVAQLSDLVSGQAPFDITETEEYVEGMRVGLDPRLLTQLRRGEFAMQSHIDLHGMIQPAAHQALTDFVLQSVRKGLRSVLVVHGRGLGSRRNYSVRRARSGSPWAALQAGRMLAAAPMASSSVAAMAYAIGSVALIS